MTTKIWLSSPHTGIKELEYVQEAFATNWIAPLGPHVDNFEKDLCAFTGAKYAAALSSGTAAIHLALILLDVKAGDFVLCQSLTFSASANPIVYQSAIPVFIDSETDTWNMDPEVLETAIIHYIQKEQKPKAIIVVHLYGMPAKIEEIIAVATKYGIPVIEDAAEALGSTFKNRPCGTFGDLGILSFNGNKIITTSGGGALISNNEEWINKARFLATQARDNAPHYQHSQIGYNYRMSNVCAAIGRGQMEVLAERVQQRRQNFDFYEASLAGYEGISFLIEANSAFSNRWLTTILVDPTKTNGITREDLRLALAKENIESRPLWKPMHLQPVFEKAHYYGGNIAEKLFTNGLCLPSGSNLAQSDKKKVLAIIQQELKVIKKI